MSGTGVLVAARAALETLSGVAYLEEGVQAEAPADSDGRPTAWVRVHDVPAPRRRFGLSGTTYLYSGLVQVDVMSPREAGRLAAAELGERVAALFPLDSELGRVLVSEPAYPVAPLDDPPYYRVPVTVPYRRWLSEP